MIPDTFPDPRVHQAFWLPQVDQRSFESFEWDAVDVDGLRSVLWEKLGWSHDRTDQALAPALQTSRTMVTQPLINQFFNPDPAEVRTLGRKRFNAAVARVKGDDSKASAAGSAKVTSA